MHKISFSSFVKGETPLDKGKGQRKIRCKSNNNREETGGETKKRGTRRRSSIKNTTITKIHQTFVKWQSHPRKEKDLKKRRKGGNRAQNKKN